MSTTRFLDRILIPSLFLLACSEAPPPAEAGGGAIGASSGGNTSSGGRPHTSSGGREGGGNTSSGGAPHTGGVTNGGGTTGSGGDTSLGGAPGEDGCAGPFYVREVVEVSFGPGDPYGRTLLPDIVLGPPGKNTEVVSLGNGGSITVSFGEGRIIDGPGVDFIVFENPFPGNAELATVEVSEDGITWHRFPCTEEQKRSDPLTKDYGHCAGWRMVGPPGSDYTNPLQAGGDQYDLADLALPDLGPIRYLRITDREDLLFNPEDVTSPRADTFDLNAVSLVHVSCD